MPGGAVVACVTFTDPDAAKPGGVDATG